MENHVFVRYNSYTIRLLKSTVQSVFRNSHKTVKPSPVSNSRTFSLPPKELMYPLVGTLHSPFLQSLETTFYLRICLFWVFSINGIIQYGIFCDRHKILKVDPCCCMCQYSIPFCGWMISRIIVQICHIVIH